jgi:hypothetical protein
VKAQRRLAEVQFLGDGDELVQLAQLDHADILKLSINSKTVF